MSKKSQSRFDAMGDRQKRFERMETERRLMPGLPVLARLDGRAFHTFTRGLERPFCEPLSMMMIETLKVLVERSGATVGYTQSDEFTLAWVPKTETSEMLFDGKIQKWVSSLTAIAVRRFNEMLPDMLPKKAKMEPEFDCRVWQVPSLDLARENFEWREADATKNAITMAAAAFYSHRQLHKVNSAGKHDLLMAKGVNFNEYPAFFKRGTYVRRETVLRALPETTLAAIPESRRPSGPVERNETRVIDMPPISRVANATDVLFYRAAPQLKLLTETPHLQQAA
ncbi:tRNA(His) guanylyltransferase Thg1 family protein [Burkholderia cenocepacia]|uniref:tRNA(His) guanylyltransferase Thg1 family protein n=1 Tax=Burkholderia cenocepacia TaxID=95486 RepID=UPI0007C64BC4|nr:tRNA(His) guanylyltransferase Thg1 family protein [Burkholderia cenocepacia]